MINQFFRRMAPVAALALGTALSGCNGADISINGEKGVPLAELDMSGPAPNELVLSSGDTVILTEGETFDLTVEGAGSDALRFVRDNEVIGITRENSRDGNGKATIRITMPPPSEVVIAGSGSVKAQSLASTSSVNIGGSGDVEFTTVAAESFEVNIGGSGRIKGAGTAKRLEINIGGSGDVDLAALKADRADVNIGGSGDVAFASDGTVEATIAGAGDVRVNGSAKCTVKAFGSGTLTCNSAAATATDAPATEPAE
ncbi:head GIN domain-containing protein [Erythrobacter sp.]|uniref:head GIN domain-containing protein n=1 Tax=Erythrobacter sp. TaxID=1042 RepID=UPI0025D67DCD|nr:head GIN domain-containing protein [Erythrobacter sp.]